MSTLFDRTLDRASIEAYITGVPAVNFPTSTKTGGWHFLNYFDLDKSVFKVSLSGIHYPNTSRYFGDFGLMDITEKLDELQIPHLHDQVYIANHYRAAADILVKWAMSDRNHCTVEVNEWFPSQEDKDTLFKLLNRSKKLLQEDGLWTKLHCWMKSQKELESQKNHIEESIFH